MQPALAGLLCHGLELARQVVCLGARNHRIPHHIAAGGKALQGILHRGRHLPVVGLELIARVDQHQAAAARRRQQALEAGKAVVAHHLDGVGPAQLGHVVVEQAAVGGVQLEQAQLVLRAHQRGGDEGRAGVLAQRFATVEAGEQLQIGGEGLRRPGFIRCTGAILLPQRQHAFAGFATGLRVAAVQTVQAGAGMGVGQQQGRVLGGGEVAQDRNQRHVLEHIGVVACMEGVAVAEHDARHRTGLCGPAGTARAGQSSNTCGMGRILRIIIGLPASLARGKSSTPT